MSLLQTAINIAIEAHKNQTDKNGQPYALHIMRVMLRGKTEDEQMAGILHDLIEDTNWTLEQLDQEGIPANVIDVVKLLTHTKEDSYEEFIEKIKNSGNKLAICVKINDLEDNMDIRRLDDVKEKDLQRFNKYLKAYRTLLPMNY